MKLYVVKNEKEWRRTEEAIYFASFYLHEAYREVYDLEMKYGYYPKFKVVELDININSERELSREECANIIYKDYEDDEEKNE